MDTVKKVLINNMIPFHISRNGTVFDTPNAVIIVRNTLSLLHEKAEFILMNAVMSFKKKVYIYLHDAEGKDDDLHYINKYFGDNYEKEEYNDYEFIAGDFKNLVHRLHNFRYIVKDERALFSLYTERIPIKIISIERQHYDKAILVMTDDMIKEMHKYYDINILDKIDFDVESDCYLSIKKNIRDIINYTIKIKVIGLEGGHRRPCRIINGMTEVCGKCMNIVYVNKEHHCKL